MKSLSHASADILLTVFCSLVLGACARQSIHSGHDTAIYYATNRRLNTDKSPERVFAAVGNSNPQNVTFGRASVSVPYNHAEGSYAGVHIRAYDPVSMSHRAFFSAVDSSILSSPPHDLILYVHGYNNSFADAAKRAAVFATDLIPKSRLTAVIYSWPSAQALLSYWKDEDSVQLNQPNLRRFLFGLHTLKHPDHIALIGHSMGCRALTFALRDLFLEELRTHGTHLQPIFDELVFIEPDVNAEYFKQNLIGAKTLCRRITIYTDRADLALKASRVVHQYQSLGLSAMPEDKRMDIIDASAARQDILGHSYDGPMFFRDLRQVLHGTPASQRTDLTSADLDNRRIFYLHGAR